jgi:hypothetical protein
VTIEDLGQIGGVQIVLVGEFFLTEWADYAPQRFYPKSFHIHRRILVSI